MFSFPLAYRVAAAFGLTLKLGGVLWAEIEKKTQKLKKSGRGSDHGSMSCPRGNHELLAYFVVLFFRNWQ